MAGEELEVWAASVVEVETEMKGQLVEAALVAAWVRKPGVFPKGGLQEEVLRVEDLKEGDPEADQLVWPEHWAQVVGLQGGCLEWAEEPQDAPPGLAWVLQGEREVVGDSEGAY